MIETKTGQFVNQTRVKRKTALLRRAKLPRQYSTLTVGLSPRPTSKAISKAMRGNIASGTKPELILAQLLRKRLARSNLPGRPEFVYSAARLVVFVHGCWWHGCPEHYKPPKTHRGYWRRKLARNLERDRLNKADLVAMGWRVLEVWEHEVKADPNGVAQQIMKSALMGSHKSNPYTRHS
jgi:DNA mismatch endonuclease, patch repair protein